MNFNQPGLFSRTEALGAGYTDDDLRRARAHGTLYTVRRGYFVRTEVFQSLDSHARHSMLARAIYLESSTQAVLSHVSAAVLHGMDMWDIPLEKVTLTIGRSYASKHGRHRILHGQPLPRGDWTEIDGLAVTTPARTIVDLARSMPLVPSVCIGDYALRTGLVTIDDLLLGVTGARNRTGIAKARQAIGMMSNRSESVGHTRSRILLDTLPLPSPQLNQLMYDEDGSLVGAADFLYPHHGVVGEFDGSDRYGAVPKPPLIEDQHCHHRLNDLGWVVVRWNWQDLSSPREVTDRIARAVMSAAGNHVPLGNSHR